MRAVLALLAVAAVAAVAVPAKGASVPTVTIAAVAARASGNYQTAGRSVPAGFYQEIVFTLINGGATPTDWTGSTDFVAGDVINGAIQLSIDGGNTWFDLCSTEPDGWLGGASPGRSGTVLYQLAQENITIPPGTLYRARATVTSHDGSTIKFGVTATINASQSG